MTMAPLIPSIPVEILEKLYTLNNKITIKFALIVFKELIVTESDLTVICKIALTAKNIDVHYDKLYSLGLVERYKDEHHNVWYTLHHRMIVDNMQCSQCEFKKKTVYKGAEKSAKYYKCKAPILCGYNYYRVAHGLLKRSMADIGLQAMTQNFRTTRSTMNVKEREYLSLTVDEWTPECFVEFMYDMYKEYYPHLETPAKNKIRKSLSQVRKAFESEYEDKYKYMVKKYITYNFEDAAKTHNIVNVYRLMQVYQMKKYLDENPWVEEIQTCGTYDIKCPYWEDGGCVITKDPRNKCTKKIRKYMLEKYN